MQNKKSVPTVGLMGFGAFGRLVTDHLHPHCRLLIHDPALSATDRALPAATEFADVASIARCDFIILAVPVDALASAIRALRPHLKPGAIVIDVGSVKVTPAAAMQTELPSFVDIIGTHPLFGPQSARNGIRGRKIAICPIRGRSTIRVAAFLKHVLGLQVFITTPEEHDKDAAVVQGLTHLIARILVRMEPLPKHLTTASFDLLLEATEMVRHDAPNVYMAIEQANPYASAVRDQFFDIAQEVRREADKPATLDCHDQKPLRYA